MEKKKEQKKKQKKKKPIWKYVIIVLVVLVAAAGLTAYAVLRYYHSLLDYQPLEEMTEAVTEAPTEFVEETDAETLAPPASDDEVLDLEQQLQANLEAMQNSSMQDVDAFNLLLIGVDTRGTDFGGRSDSMILLSIQKSSKKIVATSLLRDIFVSIPGYGTNRLNAAYARGGMPLLTETIQANFGISVDRCIVVNFSLVMDFLNTMGGVDIEVTDAEIENMNKSIAEQNRLLGLDPSVDQIPAGSGGFMHLNGKQALAYARVRYVGTDFQRTARQRTILESCFNKVRGMGLGELNDLAHEYFPRIRTDLTEGDCAYLLLELLKMSDYEMETMTIPVDGSWNFKTIRGMSVITVDFGMNAEAWAQKVNGSGK